MMRGASARRASLAVLSAGALAVGCADTPRAKPPPPSLADVTDPCKHPHTEACEFCQLDPGHCYPGDDALAAQFLGMQFSGFTSHDPMGLLQCKMEAARKGNGCWLDSVIRDFAPGGFYPDEGKLKEFIQLGVEDERVPAMVAKAAYIQDTDPSGAADLYIRAATKGHCLVQAMLAASYLDGVFTEINEAKAYFWWLRSQAPRQSTTVTRSPYIAARLKDQFGYSYSARGDMPCSLHHPRLDALKTGVFAQEVRDFILEGHPLGHPFTDELERYKDVRTVADGASESVALPSPSGTGLPLPASNWQKLSLSETTTLSREISRENLYDKLSRSVYVVYAAPSKRAFQTRQNVAQGSGVAVKHDTVLTNCHIIRNKPEVFVVVSGHLKRAKVAAAHLEADACILRIEDTSLSLE